MDVDIQITSEKERKEALEELKEKFPFIDEEKFLKMCKKIPNAVIDLVGEERIKRMKRPFRKAIKHQIAKICLEIHKLRLMLKEREYIKEKRAKKEAEIYT